MGTGRSWSALALGAALFAAVPAWAQDSAAELDTLIDQSSTPEGALTLAHGQADGGNLLEAAATLERALLGNPRATALRLYYAAILCRLDDRQRAAIELGKAGGAPSPEVEAACGAIQPVGTARNDDGFTGQLSAGLAWDNNASGAIAIQFDIPGLTYPRQEGLAFIGSAAIAGRAGLGDTGLYAYGGASVQTRNRLSGPRYDYQVGSAVAGIGLRGGMLDAGVGGVVTHAIVDGNRFLTEYGVQSHVALLLGQDTRVTLRAEVDDQDYIDFPLFSRDGTRYDLAFDLQDGGPESASYVIGGGWERKTADTNYFAYVAYRAYGALRVPFGASGAYGLLSGTYRHIDYYNDPFTRDYVEERYYARGAIGVPILPHLIAEGAVNYTRRNYNPASFVRDYENVGGELRLIFKFGK